MSFVNQDLQKLQNNIITNWNKNRADLQLKFCSIFFTFNVYFFVNSKSNPKPSCDFCKKVKLPIDFFTDIWYYDYTNIRSFRLFKLED